jgi:hypothetical protein
MCDFCGHYPCASRCPNAPEPRVVCLCDNCENEILEGELMYQLDIGTVCEDCILMYKKYAEIEEDF